jgi:transcriptional regulator with XRE-family HTH domain
MASWSERVELTDEEIADLTDGELVEPHRFLVAEIERLGQILQQSAEGAISPAEAAALMMGLAPSLSRFEIELMMAKVESRPPREIESMLAESLSRPPTDQEVRFSKYWIMRGRLEREMDRRLREMLRSARLALGLTHRDVGRVAGMHSKFVDEIEQGRRGWSEYRGLFERTCIEGGLGSVEESFHRSVWFPLADPRLCRTIRPVTVDPAWLAGNDGAVAALARSIREDRAFHLLPILGDALEESGCVDPAILDHCRSPGEHARGCWVVDALVSALRRC